jgi:plasmid stabilization system protein ParE
VRRIIWTDEAATNLEEIIQHIAQFDSQAAMRLAGQAKALADSLAEHSERGRRISRGRRQLTLLAPYLMRDRVAADTVYILNIRHGARRPD